MARREQSRAACPMISEMIIPIETIPFPTCVAITPGVAPKNHIWLASVRSLAPTSLFKAEGVLDEETMAIRSMMATLSHTTRAHDITAITSVWTMMLQQQPSVTIVAKNVKMID